MGNTKRRIFWFTLGVTTTLAIQQIPTQQPQPGETAYITPQHRTVWDIAKERFPEKDTRDIIADIHLLNPGIEYGRTQIGQAIILPRGE